MTDKEIDYKILQRENENLLKANKDLVREIDALGEENKRLKALFAEYIKPIDKFIKDRENKAVKDCEKVKEIKKALETCMHTRVSSCRECPYNYTNTKTKHSECFRMAEHALTLINELENENEILKINMHETENLSFQINQMNGNLVLENQALKDRIAELEEENGELKQHVAEVEKGIINIAKERNKKDELASKFIDSYNDSLKQFVEKLKKRLNLGLYEWQYAEVDSKTIDEILKEYIDEE